MKISAHSSELHRSNDLPDQPKLQRVLATPQSYALPASCLCSAKPLQEPITLPIMAETALEAVVNIPLPSVEALAISLEVLACESKNKLPTDPSVREKLVEEIVRFSLNKLGSVTD